MKKIFSSEIFWVAFLSLIIISLSMFPLYHHLKETPANQVYLAQHNNQLDFPMFISEIRQGQEGHLTEVQKLTSEKQMGTWIHLFYLVVGWVTLPFHLNPIIAYHGARVVVGYLLLLTFFYFLKLFFKDKLTALTIFFLTVYSTGFPGIIAEPNKPWSFKLPYIMDLFSGYDVLQRATFLPHGMMRDVLFLGVVIFWIKLWEKKKIKYFWRAIVCGFFLGFFSPTHALILYLTLNAKYLVLFLCACVRKEKWPIFRLDLKLTLIYCLTTVWSSLYINWAFSVTVWKIVKDWEAVQWFPGTFRDYILANGPLILLSIPALFIFSLALIVTMAGKNNMIMSRWGRTVKIYLISETDFVKKYLLLSIPLLTLFFLFSPVARIFGVSNFRFMGIPLQVFWGTLGGLTLTWFVKKIVIITHNYQTTLIVVALLLFLPSIPSYALSLEQQSQQYLPPVAFNVYPNKNFYAGLKWLEKNTKADEIVFSDIGIGSLIPAYAGNVVYLGHPVSTVNFTQKQQEIVSFYKTDIPAEEARKFLRDRNIQYVVWSYDEHGYYKGDPAKYSTFLNLRFNNPEIQIYEVK